MEIELELFAVEPFAVRRSDADFASLILDRRS
jgi:hypothetical protein